MFSVSLRSRSWLVIPLALGILSGACSRIPEPPPIKNNLLTQYSQAKYFWQQLEVAQKIVKGGDASILADLEPVLTLEDRHLRGNAAFVFASFGDRRGFETIRVMLADRSDRPEGQGIPGGRFTAAGQIRADRYYAVHLLGLLKDPRAVDLIVPLLDDPDLNYKVPWALAEIGDPSARQALNAALTHADPKVRASAIDAIESLKTFKPK